MLSDFNKERAEGEVEQQEGLYAGNVLLCPNEAANAATRWPLDETEGIHDDEFDPWADDYLDGQPVRNKADHSTSAAAATQSNITNNVPVNTTDCAQIDSEAEA